MRLLFQWEEDPQSTPGMISRKGGQAGRGDGECGLAARDRHPEERPGYPPRSPDSSASVPAALRGSSVPGAATAAPYASPSHRVLWQATHFLLSLRSDSGGQDQDLAPQCPPREGCPVHGNFSVPLHSPPALLLLHPSLSQPPASLRESHASSHGKRAGPFHQLSEGSGPFTGGTAVDTHIPGSSPVRLRQLPLQFRNVPQML